MSTKMPSSRRFESALLAVIILLLGLNFTYKLVSLVRLYHTPRDLLNGGIWDVERKPVAFAFDSGLHYDFNASHAWRALVPGGNGLVHLGPSHEPFLPSMFHQLRCLDVMRDQLTHPLAQREEQPARHCMNYIRQMILCRGDTNLDPYQYPSNIHPVEPHPVRRCLDWRAVYKAVEENQREYAETVGGRHT